MYLARLNPVGAKYGGKISKKTHDIVNIDQVKKKCERLNFLISGKFKDEINVFYLLNPNELFNTEILNILFYLWVLLNRR